MIFWHSSNSRYPYREYYYNVLFSLHNHGKVEADLESLESLMNHNILDLRGGDEPRCRFG